MADRIQIACGTKLALAARIVELHRLYGDHVVATNRAPQQVWVEQERLWTATITLAPVAQRDPDLTHITRVENPRKRTHGWMARLARSGERRYAWFGDGTHGGRDLSLEAAKVWRDQQVAALERQMPHYEVPG